MALGSYWEDVEPQVAGAVRERIKEFQDAGIGGVDLYLACFGPALQKFSEHWPLRRGTPRPQPEARKRRKQAEMFEEAVGPVRGDAGRCARCCSTRSEALATATAHAHEGTY